MANRKIAWDTAALHHFDRAIRYIAKDSLTNAENVRLDIIEKIDQLLRHPTKHAPDRYKKNNDGNFRAFEVHRYRISYHVSINEIRIVRLRHTSMEPKGY